MAESAVRTDKRFQLMVYGAIAVITTVVMGISLSVTHMPTIRWASALLLIGMLATIVFLAVEL